MAISVFPAGGGEFITNDFVVDMNDTSNNVIDLGRSYAEGAYDISLATGDTSFDIYAIDADGNSVGYTNDATLVCSAAFTQLAILGVAQDERLTFAFSGASNAANAEGTATGGGAYLENATPTDLPNQDDTTTVTGGNFASDVQIFFESGATSTAAKNITRNDSTELIVTRPDALDPALDPWSLRAVNPGIAEPTGTNANILSDVIDAGALPVWVTTSPLASAVVGVAYSETLEATDADGAVTYSVTSGTLPTGLSLNSSTGEISGTPSAGSGGSATFTVTATDEGGNANSRQFDLVVAKATGGTISSVNGFIVHTFNASDDFEVVEDITAAEYIILAGGGGAPNNIATGGGGGGGLLSSITGFQSGENTSALASEDFIAGTYTITVGAGGSGSQGSDSTLGNIGTAIGGGVGGGGNGGSGGGGLGGAGGTGTTGQGFDGGGTNASFGEGGGGGTFESGTTTNSANQSADGGKGTHNFLDQRGWGAGGAGGQDGNVYGDGGGSSGNDQATYAGGGNTVAVANFGGGGGKTISGSQSGGSGKVVIRYS